MEIWNVLLDLYNMTNKKNFSGRYTNYNIRYDLAPPGAYGGNIDLKKFKKILFTGIILLYKQNFVFNKMR